MLQSRIDYINDVNEYISKSKHLLNEILDGFGWNNSVGTNNCEGSVIVSCPNEDGHRIPERSLEGHITKCSLRKNGYNLQDVLFPPAIDPGHNVIVIDKYLQNDILEKTSFGGGKSTLATHSIEQKQRVRSVPQTSDRLFSEFSSEERLAIYDYAVKNTSVDTESLENDINLPFNQSQKSSKPKTLEQLLAAERDAKRRRIKYRSKNVHTNRKTQTEILREVIQSQMEGYEEWLQHEGHQTKLKFVKPDIESSTDKPSDPTNQCHLRTITRNWDDWNYRYKGNPHKRYMVILQEEQDAEQSKSSSRDHVSRKRPSRDSYSRDEYRSERKNEYYNKEKTKKYRIKEEDYRSHKKYNDQHSKEPRSERSENDWKLKDRNTEVKQHYKTRDGVRHDSKSYDKEYGKHYKHRREYYEEEPLDRGRNSRHYDSSLTDTNDTDYHKKRHKDKKYKHKKRHKSEKHRSDRHDSNRKGRVYKSDLETNSNTSHSDNS